MTSFSFIIFLVRLPTSLIFLYFILHCTALHGTIRYDTAQGDAISHDTTRHGAVRYDTAQPSTVRLREIDAIRYAQLIKMRRDTLQHDMIYVRMRAKTRNADKMKSKGKQVSKTKL